MAGNVTVCDEEVFKNLTEMITPILDVFQDCLRIVQPPAPRYLFSPCCMVPTHCTNVGKQGHAEQLLGETIKLRSTLKKVLLKRYPEKVWILDSCCMVPNVADLAVPERAVALKKVCAKDGVHFLQEGYMNTAVEIGRVAGILLSGHSAQMPIRASDTASVHVSGDKRYYWHGFCSPVGSLRKDGPKFGKRGALHDKSHRRFFPYGRRGSWKGPF